VEFHNARGHLCRPKDFVLENREIARQRMARFFERIGLAYRVESANDPSLLVNSASRPLSERIPVEVRDSCQPAL